MPFRKYKKRQRYLKVAIPKGFHKEILIFNGEIVGQIEYAPADASGLPISGANVFVMNCIWVLRRAKGHNFGKVLLSHVVERITKHEKDVSGLATIALEGHWSGWMKREQMEKLGFKALDSIKIRHKVKHTELCFRVYLMWLPFRKEITLPSWDKSKILEGFDFCIAHPLYHPEYMKDKEIFKRC
jgi:GNAT superfamily N-acetyltransferase